MEWAVEDPRVVRAATVVAVVADLAWAVAVIGAVHQAGTMGKEAGWVRRGAAVAVREGSEAMVGAAAVLEMPERAAVPNAEHRTRMVGQDCHRHTHVSTCATHKQWSSLAQSIRKCRLAS